MAEKVARGDVRMFRFTPPDKQRPVVVLTCAVNLHNIITVPKEGLGRRVAQLDERRLDQICAAIAFALGCRA